MAAMKSFDAENCCHLVNSVSSWSVIRVHSYFFTPKVLGMWHN